MGLIGFVKQFFVKSEILRKIFNAHMIVAKVGDLDLNIQICAETLDLRVKLQPYVFLNGL